MLEKTIKKQITSGVGPFSYQWSADDSCVSFSVPNGTTDEFIETTVFFEDANCQSTATVTLFITAADGCTLSETIAVGDPCASFSVSEIGFVNPLTFTATAGNTDCSSANFSWSYNSNFFEPVSITDAPFTSKLVLKIKDPKLPASTAINVSVDSCGCSDTKSFSYTPCIPRAPDFEAELNFGTVSYASPFISLQTPTKCGYTYNLGTYSFETPTGITATFLDGPRVVFSADDTFTPGVYIGSYTLKTSEGISTLPGTITLKVNAPDPNPIVIADEVFTLDCDVSPGDIIEFVIEDNITATGTIDWSSWQLTSVPSPVATTIELDTNLDGDHVIKYTVPSPVQADAFGWTISDTEGNFASASVTAIRDCTGTPTANADTATAPCGGSVTIDILSNDVANGAPFLNNTLTITQAPTKGTLTLPGDGTVIYTAFFNVTGSDTFKYTIDNAYGKTSNEATVTITINCAGSSATTTLCN